MATGGLVIALLFKVISVFKEGYDILVISSVLKNEIWFVLGMCLCVIDFTSMTQNIRWRNIGAGLAILYLLRQAS